MSPKSFFLILFLTSIDGACLNDCSQHGDCVWNNDRGAPGDRHANSSYNSLFRCDCDIGYKGISCNETNITVTDDSKTGKKIETIEEKLEEEEKNMNRIFGNELTVVLIVSYVFGGIGFIITVWSIYKCIKGRRNMIREKRLREMSILPHTSRYTSI